MISFIFYLTFLLIFVVLAVYAERKTAAFIQNRLGPMEVGPKGLLQTIADLLKMLQKEDIRAHAVDLIPYLIAPFIVFGAVFCGFAVLPIHEDMSGAAIDSGVFFLLAIVSLDVLGILMAGWASNNKYSLYGAMRSVAQIVSYEVPLGLSVLCVIIMNGTLDLNEISRLQSGQGMWGWNIFYYPILIIPFIIFFIAALAEANRAPFDLPESESELISGYHTEYSGFRWGIFMLSEYGMMLLVAILGATLFFGGWSSPFSHVATSPIWGTFWLLIKALILVFAQMWVRWTFPRLRVDQLMSLSWQYLTPAAIMMLFIGTAWKLWVITFG